MLNYKNMDKEKRNEVRACTLLVIYAILGLIIRYFIIPPCNSGVDYFHIVVQYAIIFIIIGISAGLYSFFFRKKPLYRVAQGLVTGFSVGFGGMTVYALAFNPCI